MVEEQPTAAATTTPQRLGGRSNDDDRTATTTTGRTTTTTILLTPDEIRRRRIEALDRTNLNTIQQQQQQQQQQQPSAVPTTRRPDPEPYHHVPPANNTTDDNEVDEELQAALALSLQDVGAAISPMVLDTTTPTVARLPNERPPFPSSTNLPQQQQAATTANHPWIGTTTEPIATTTTTQSTSCSSKVTAATTETTILQMINASAQPLSNNMIAGCNQLLWDDQLTTDSDKRRWISQGIDVRSSTSLTLDCNHHRLDTTAQSEPYLHKEIDSMNDKSNGETIIEGFEIIPQGVIEEQSTTIPSITMESIAQSHLPWGLIQQHGGPCGVLAAIQAELLRKLLFETSTSRNGTYTTDATTTTTTTTTIATVAATTTSDNNDRQPFPVRNALAHAIALVLSRAALTPSSSSNKSSDTKENASLATGAAAVQIVLPTHSRELTMQDFEPGMMAASHNSNPVTTTTASSSLTVFTIPALSDMNPSQGEVTNAVTPKRQKVTTTTTNDNSNEHLDERINQLTHIVERFLLDDAGGCDQQSDKRPSSPLDCFRGHGGVLLLVLSIIASRTISRIIDDFDDPVGTRLTGQFGHCSQELINLLLTGQAVSNVFDNTLSPSGDMICRGIQRRPAIGYLTQLEAMRYCEVGGYYKMPLYPIWVVGSTSHFTVLFGDPAALKESKSDMLLDECRRVFKAVEGGEENGFIQTDQLTTVLKNLKIDIGGTNESDEAARIQTLAASLEVSGAGIILWDDFWKAVSRLLTGASLETVLQAGDTNMSISPINVDAANEPPLLLTNYASNADIEFRPEARRPETRVAASASVYPNYMESDEEMARRLAAEWDNVGAAGMLALSATTVPPVQNEPTISTMPTSAMDDEEYAQFLQKQYDSENAVDAAISGGGDGGSVAAISGSPFQVLSDTDDTASLPATPTQTAFVGDDDLEDTKPAAQIGMSTESLPFEQYGDTFSLYHYNGLRGGILTPFRITRLTAEEAVGASIALNRGTGGASSGTQDLEDVVRTKWPSCAINWLGKAPPFID